MPEEIVEAVCSHADYMKIPRDTPLKKGDKAFARSVDRSYVYGGTEAVGRPLLDHVAFLIDALKPIAPQIGL